MTAHNLHVMMERHMKFRSMVKLALHRVGMSVCFGQRVTKERHEVVVWRMGRSERQVIDAMREVGHNQMDLVMKRFGLHMQITRYTIHHQVSQYLTSRMMLLVPFIVGQSLFIVIGIAIGAVVTTLAGVYPLLGILSLLKKMMCSSVSKKDFRTKKATATRMNS